MLPKNGPNTEREERVYRLRLEYFLEICLKYCVFSYFFSFKQLPL